MPPLVASAAVARIEDNLKHIDNNDSDNDGDDDDDDNDDNNNNNDDAANDWLTLQRQMIT